MKVYLTNTINDISMITFFNDRKNIEKIVFEKICYTKKCDNILKHKFSLSLKKSLDKNMLYSFTTSFSSNEYETKDFYLGDIIKEQKFRYFDNEKLKEVELSIPSGEPTLEEITKNPILSSLFRDFVLAYNKSSLKNPIDIYEVYMNRKFYPGDAFENFLYSTCANNNTLVNLIKDAYLKEKGLKNNVIKKFDLGDFKNVR